VKFRINVIIGEYKRSVIHSLGNHYLVDTV